MSSRKSYYNSYGQKIRSPKAYAKTGAPMYSTFYTKSGTKIKDPEQYVYTGKDLYVDKDENEEKTIYVVHCKKNKKYIGETNDIERRADEHFSGRGSKVTKKFEPVKIEEIKTVPGFFAKETEQYYTEKYIDKYGYDKVRGGSYTNSKTLV